ncbi:polysaccharide pyruvyl transferase family protein [Sphingobium sp.]|uniref:polysaccharide pyruvyl transferase family protein n=1 Tax=Sphingobium sp. TaxID=1912891 RepID=UPI003B3B2F2D
MKKIGIVSIERNVDTNILSFDEVYKSVGMNTGNFMFTEAVYRQLNAETQCIGFSYKPDQANKELDHIVIPAANWINSYNDWGWLCDILEKTHIPATVVGLGIQNDNNDIKNFKASESSIRLARILSQKSPLISVRGQITKSYLETLGIKNSIVTGCPSLYMKLDDYKNGIDKRESIVIQSTRYGISEKFLKQDSINNSLFSICKKLDADMIFQSEIEEMMILVKQDSEARNISDNAIDYLSKLYGFERKNDFFDYLRKRCRVFFDVNHWSNFLRDRYGVIGTRLHGAIIALNSGVPALLIPHDSRTSEMADFAGIPTLTASEAASLNTLEEAKEKLSLADVKKFQATRARNGVIYRAFLTACNLPYREEALF